MILSHKDKKHIKGIYKLKKNNADILIDFKYLLTKKCLVKESNYGYI